MKPYSKLRLAIMIVFTSVAWTQQRATVAWFPTQSAPSSENYAGTASCASCHRSESKRAAASQMGNSIILPAKKYLDAPDLRFKRGPYAYTLYRDGDARLTVSDGNRQITDPIFAMIGAGEFLHSYLLRHDGVPYRAAVDSVTARHGLDLDNEACPPGSLEEALGRHHSEKYVRTCLSCYSPASVAGDSIVSFRQGCVTPRRLHC